MNKKIIKSDDQKVNRQSVNQKSESTIYESKKWIDNLMIKKVNRQSMNQIIRKSDNQKNQIDNMIIKKVNR